VTAQVCTWRHLVSMIDRWLLLMCSGERLAFGHYYLRPHETFHEPTRRFFHCELFRVPLYDLVPLDAVVGLCTIMDLQTYCRVSHIPSYPPTYIMDLQTYCRVSHIPTYIMDLQSYCRVSHIPSYPPTYIMDLQSYCRMSHIPIYSTSCYSCVINIHCWGTFSAFAFIALPSARACVCMINIHCWVKVAKGCKEITTVAVV